ncbi:MAG TPA: MFS transporter [Gaiellales bacterium]|jgi:MFS family permease|nr:MFS transporter [Gaiellales bacterium]
MEPYRRITVAVGVSMFVDASLYLAVLPLLPDYVDRFGLTTLQAGVVLAAYPVSVPFVSIACIIWVPRIGARRITVMSAVLMTAATVVFAWAPTATILTLARFLQGAASGSIWTASMSWVTDNAPPGRRGRESGIVMGMLSAGSVAGPGIGALASVAGSGVAFGLVAAVSGTGIVLALLAPAGRTVVTEHDVRGAIARGARQPATQAAIALAVVDLIAFGAVDLLVPIHLGSHGESVVVIASAIGVGALLGAAAGPFAGRLVDRIGPAPVGLAVAYSVVAIPIVLALTPPNWVQLAVLVVGGPMFSIVGSAIFPLSTLGADAAGVSHVTVTGLMGATWAAGFTIVPVALGVVADWTSPAVAYAVVVIAVAPVMLLLTRNVRRSALVSQA